MSSLRQTRTRELIGRAFSAVEDIVYIGLGLLLACVAIALLGNAATTFVQSLLSHTLSTNIISLLDHLLLILLVVELLYTVQISFREHAVIPEPFLLIGLIAAIRRVLVLTAEVGRAGKNAEPPTQFFIQELAVLTFLIVALAASLYVLQRRDTQAVASR